MNLTLAIIALSLSLASLALSCVAGYYNYQAGKELKKIERIRDIERRARAGMPDE